MRWKAQDVNLPKHPPGSSEDAFTTVGLGSWAIGNEVRPLDEVLLLWCELKPGQAMITGQSIFIEKP
jgi:hypothetical protein